MVVIWGSGLYGKVDEVPRVCHVATRFGHLYYVPLFPLGSFAVFHQDGSDFQGVPLPLSFKSILVGWLRGSLVVGAIVGVVLTIIGFSDHRPVDGAATLVATLLAIGLVIGSYYLPFITQASYERAKQIAERAGLSPTAMLMIEVHYGRLTAEQADAELARIQAAEEAIHPAELVIENPGS